MKILANAPRDITLPGEIRPATSRPETAIGETARKHANDRGGTGVRTSGRLAGVEVATTTLPRKAFLTVSDMFDDEGVATATRKQSINVSPFNQTISE